MATITFYFLDGKTRTFKNARVSKYKNRYHVWPMGPHVPGTKPMFSVPYSALHAVSRTGRKGIDISKY